MNRHIDHLVNFVIVLTLMLVGCANGESNLSSGSGELKSTISADNNNFIGISPAETP